MRMRRALPQYFALGLLLCATATPLLAQGSLPTPSPSAPLFEERPFGPLPPPTEPPAPRHVLEDAERKPIPRAWLIGGALAAAVVLLLLLWGALRAWRSSNLFDQQYRFPPIGEAAVRLGGKKSGGHSAQISLVPRPDDAAVPNETR